MGASRGEATRVAAVAARGTGAVVGGEARAARQATTVLGRGRVRAVLASLALIAGTVLAGLAIRAMRAVGTRQLADLALAARV